MPIQPLTACEWQREGEVGNQLGLVLGIAILIGGSTSMAQSKPIPVKQPQGNGATLPQAPKMERAEIAALRPGNLSTPSAADPVVREFAIARSPERARLGARFYMLNGLNVGMMALDMSLSQHCIAEHRCREANPLMPRSLAARISIAAVFAGVGLYASHRMKVRGTGLWWVPPFFGTVAHAIGAASGLSQ